MSKELKIFPLEKSVMLLTFLALLELFEVLARENSYNF